MDMPELIPLKMEVDGQQSDIAQHHLNHTHPTHITADPSNPSAPPEIQNPEFLAPPTPATAAANRLMLAIDQVLKHFPKALADASAQADAATQEPPAPSLAPTHASAHEMLLCDEEVPPLDMERGLVVANVGTCAPEVEKTVLSVLSGTLKSIVASVSVE